MANGWETVAEATAKPASGTSAPTPSRAWETVADVKVKPLTTRLGEAITEGPLAEAAEHYKETGRELGKESVLKRAATAVPGAVEAGAGMIFGMGVASGAGLRGLYQGTANLLQGKPFMEGFQEGMTRVTEAAADIPYAPETKAGKFLTSIIDFIPAALKTTGEVAFKAGGETEGAALAGATTEAIATAFLLRPALPGRPAPGRTPGAKKVRDAFDELAKDSPEQARDIARNLEEVDPALKKELDKRIDSITPTKKQVKAMPQAAARPLGIAVSEMDVADAFNAAKANRVQAEPPAETAAGAAAANASATMGAAMDIHTTPALGALRSGRGARQTGAVKLPGGMWEPTGLKTLVDSLYANLAMTQPRGSPEAKTALAWSDRAVTRHFNRYAGTAKDPLNDVRIPMLGENVRWEDVMDQAVTSRPARTYQVGTREDITPTGISRREISLQERYPWAQKAPPEEAVWKMGETSRGEVTQRMAVADYLRHVGDYMREHVPPERWQQYDLVRAVRETAAQDARQAKAMGKAQGYHTDKLPLVKDYGDGMKWVEVKGPEVLDAEQAATVKEVRPGEFQAHYPDGKPIMRIDPFTKKETPVVEDTAVKAYNAGQLANEGNVMGHCVGGYCEAVRRGESRILSLRDAKGQSHVTIEVDPGGLTSEGRMHLREALGREPTPKEIADEIAGYGMDLAEPTNIIQIKGKQNRTPNPEYLPYVQDFVKSGQWGEVGDLQNARLWKHEGKFYTREEINASEELTNAFASRNVRSDTFDPGFGPLRGPGRRQVGALNIDPIRAIQAAFDIAKGAVRRFPGEQRMEREIASSAEHLIRAVAPELRGPEARTAAATLGSAMATQMRQDSVRFYQSEPRQRFWLQRGPEEARMFRDGYERGATFEDPVLNKAAEGYRNWAEQVYQKEQGLGIKYEPIDNYLPHMFEDREGVARYLHNRFGAKWNNPFFMKERGFDMYAEAEKAGYRPKFWSPEDMMLAREHASNIAEMKIQALRDMKEFGVARELKPGDRLEVGETEWRSPNGQRYAVGDVANQVLHNAFNTRSLWQMEGPLGSSFRAAMLLKNTIVPIKLFSLFHPVHVATMQGADALVTATKGLAGGNIGAGRYTLEAIGNQYFKNLIGVSRQGYRLRKVWEGKVPESELTAADKRALGWMLEGGFIADLSPELKTNWTRSFRNSVDEAKYGEAAFKLPFVMLEQVFQKPIMEVWIPSLKTASYVNAAARALEANPELLTNRQARMEAFRKIQKSVDNRFGEMQYSTTFMNRTVKDIGVGSLLSLGWQLGFLREYGGAAGEAARGVTRPGELRKMTAKGELDRALFVTFYTTQAMMLGGLMTYAMTGELPQSLIDYVYPRTGDTNPDGTPARVSTPYYTREFMMISKHMQQEGAAAGLAHLVGSKLSPAIGVVKAWATNLNFFGAEISDPNSPFMKRLGQKVAWTLTELDPIFVESLQRAPGRPVGKTVGLGFMGFSPAPQYVSKPETEAQISATFRRYYKATTPYERAEYGPDNSKLRAYYQMGDSEKFSEQLTMMRDKYNLNSDQMRRLRRNLRADPNVKMFRALSDAQQIHLLKNMPEEDRAQYLRYARKSALARMGAE